MRASTTRSPSLEEVLRAAIDYRLLGVHTALPARVESYDAASQKISAKPLVRALTPTADGGELNESVPIINDVPVVFPRAGGFFISLPVQQGDHVLLIFNERSVDKFIAGEGDEVDPIDPRDHDLSDAVALVGFYPFSKSLADAISANLVLGKEAGTQVHIKDGEIDLGSENAADFVAQAQKVLTELSAIIGKYNEHTHTKVTTGSDVSGPAVPLMITPPGSVAAAVVKAD